MNGTGQQALMDQLTLVLSHLRNAKVALNESTPHLRDYPSREQWKFAHDRALDHYTALCRLVDSIGADRHAIRNHGYVRGTFDVE